MSPTDSLFATPVLLSSMELLPLAPLGARRIVADVLYLHRENKANKVTDSEISYDNGLLD